MLSGVVGESASDTGKRSVRSRSGAAVPGVGPSVGVRGCRGVHAGIVRRGFRGARRRERRTFDITAWLKSGPAIRHGGSPQVAAGRVTRHAERRRRGARRTRARRRRSRAPRARARRARAASPQPGANDGRSDRAWACSARSSRWGRRSRRWRPATSRQWPVRWWSPSRRRSSGSRPARWPTSVAAARQNWVTETIREQRYLAEQVAQEMQSFQLLS